jgi:trigger factor
MLDIAMSTLRDKHVVLREPEEPRPAQQGDELTVQLESFVDGEPLDDRDENGEVRESTIVLEPDRVVEGLYEGLLGMMPDESREITAQMSDDHANEQVRGKEVLFKVKLLRLQERLLPDWEELPVLEEFEGTLDELREKTRGELIDTARTNAERTMLDTYIKQLVEHSEYDIPDALIEREADDMLHRQGHEFERYGISLEQMLKYRGKTHDEAVDELKPQAEERLKNTLALGEVIRAEGLTVDDAEVDAEVERMLDTYEEDQRERARILLTTQLRPTVASSVLDKKLRERLVVISTGNAPALEAGDDGADAEASASAEADAFVADAGSEGMEASAGAEAEDGAADVEVPAIGKTEP